MADAPSLDEILRGVAPECLDQPCRDDHLRERELSQQIRLVFNDVYVSRRQGTGYTYSAVTNEAQKVRYNNRYLCFPPCGGHAGSNYVQMI